MNENNDSSDCDIILKKKISDKTVKENKETDDAYYFFSYFPRYRNEGLSDENSENIINVKEKNKQAIEYFKHKIIEILNPNQEFVICVIPPSSIKAEASGISLIAKEICKVNSNWIDGTEIIKRIKTINQKHDKTKEYPKYLTEQGSLEITNLEKIKDKWILLLDDIATKCQAIKITKTKLKYAGAKRIISLTLGKTIFLEKQITI